MAGNRHDEALEAAARAAEILSSETVLAVDRGTALVLVALVETAQSCFQEAESALAESIAIFAEHGETRRYLDAIQTHAIIALAQDDVPRAREWYISAYEEADRLDDDRERARTIHNLGYCALLMNDLDTANDYLARGLS